MAIDWTCDEFVPIVTDEPDNRILAAAVARWAKAIIAGEQGLLRLGSYQGISIPTRAEFLALLHKDR